MFNPDMGLWQGRIDSADGDTALRWHQMIEKLAPDADPGVALLGFACDEGVRRNGGRVGAKDGPRAIRQALANLAWHHDHPVYDAGNISCTDGDLEGAQNRLRKAVYDVINARQRPLVLGGGHETAWGTYRGLLQAVQQLDPYLKVASINIDAHLDLRADKRATSGTPFAQIAGWCRETDRLFRYMCLGVSEAANTAALFDRAKRFEVEWRKDTDLSPSRMDDTLNALASFVNRIDLIHLSIDLDVLSPGVMPAVSAPATRGVSLEAVESIVAALLPSGKVCVVEIVELNPALDADGCGARVAAGLAWQIAKDWPLVPVE